MIKKQGFRNRVNEIFKNHKLNMEVQKAVLTFFEKLKKYSEFLCNFEIKVKNNSTINEFFRKELDIYLKEMISEAYYFEEKVKSLIIRKKVRELFRAAIGKYIYKSPIIKWAYEKPKGYPGDYLIFEMFYNGISSAKGIGYYLDNWTLKYDLPNAVIYRKNKLKNILNKQIRNSRNKIDILNIGCGSSREIRELLIEEKFNLNNIAFTCLDQDEEALNFSKKALNEINPNIKISFLRKDILSIIGLREGKNEIKKQDIIYSAGVADYFLKTTFENFIQFSFGLLKPKGKIIIPLCSSHNPKLYVPLRWFCEWNFFSHNVNDIKNLIKIDLQIKKVKIIWEEKNPIFFIIIEK
ncbi:MAG: methyltransferase domain-containing protein [Candidatus Ratteibacteria bacterium]